ncbi:MAG TPA: hypothetical protein VJL81_09760 [Solirubrobacterales bacterium]|nr:hypothetical protein [Solirubrobacterales bacterium]
MEAERVVDELLDLPLATVDEARASAPEAPGFYAWWCERAAVPADLPAPPHPSGPYALLYVGVAPNGPGSASNLRKRLRQHTSANIGSSTFRFSLTALLWQQEGWRPIWTGRPALEDGALASLGAWQSKHLAVRWCEAATPWSTEPDVISLMRAPMNRNHNVRHPFYTSMGVARNELRRAARTP